MITAETLGLYVDTEMLEIWTFWLIWLFAEEMPQKVTWGSWLMAH